MTDLFPDLETLAKSEYLFRIVDNGGATYDRYTVIFSDGDALMMGGDGGTCWGSGDYVEYAEKMVEEGSEVDLALGDLDTRCQNAILARVNEAFRDYIVDLETGAKSLPNGRDGARENEGTQDCYGNGLYRVGAQYFIRLDGHPDDDRGPYETLTEALRASLPDIHGLAGPEYHSTLHPGWLAPTPGVAEAVAKLEKIVEES